MILLFYLGRKIFSKYNSFSRARSIGNRLKIWCISGRHINLSEIAIRNFFINLALRKILPNLRKIWPDYILIKKNWEIMNQNRVKFGKSRSLEKIVKFVFSVTPIRIYSVSNGNNGKTRKLYEYLRLEMDPKRKTSRKI